MRGNKEFFQSAKTLSRNPLGIIALFIILVYAVASIVISLGRSEFYDNPYHPSVLFLAGFPVVVLIVFAYLVSKHHEKLYGPQDYQNTQDFFRTLKVPDAVKADNTGIATSDKNKQDVHEDAKTRIDKSYNDMVKFGFCLLHEAEVIRQRTAPRSGRYRVRVWIEPIENRSLGDIESVTYRVWENFENPVLTTTDKESNFDLWLNIYGEFPIIALLKNRNGDTYELQRYLDLPGRPQD